MTKYYDCGSDGQTDQCLSGMVENEKGCYVRSEDYDMLKLDYESNLAALREENDRLRAENVNLREDASAVFAKDMRVTDGSLILSAKSSVVCALAEFARSTLSAHKAENFVTSTMTFSDSDDSFYITIGRATGATVSEKYQYKCTELAALREENERLKSELKMYATMFLGTV